MISLDLIEFADLVRPMEIADQVFKQNNWINSAVPLEEIAKAAGIKDIQYAPLKSFEGTLLANDAKTEGVIVINSDARHERLRIPRHSATQSTNILPPIP